MLAGVDFHQAEVPHPVMSQRMRLGADGELGTFQGMLNSLDELSVWDRCPGLSTIWSLHRLNIPQGNLMSAAMQDEICVGLFGLAGWVSSRSTIRGSPF